MKSYDFYMCRMLGILSRQSGSAMEPLIDAPQSLLKQSEVDPKRRQGDGWGIGWFEGGRPTVFKSPGPVFEEEKKFRQVAGALHSSCLLAHVRWASNPLKLPKEELIGPAHTQPFTYRRWMFVHNGTLYIPREAAAALGPWRNQIRGKNDSEVLFYWLLRALYPILKKRSSRIDQVASAVRGSVEGLHWLWRECRLRYPLYRHAFHGLNWVLTDGKVLIALCYASPEGFGASRALTSPAQPYFQLQLRAAPGQLTIASEPLDQGPGWEPMKHGELLVAVRRRSGIEVQRTPTL